MSSRDEASSWIFYFIFGIIMYKERMAFVLVSRQVGMT